VVESGGRRGHGAARDSGRACRSDFTAERNLPVVDWRLAATGEVGGSGQEGKWISAGKLVHA
jgi:hypothetical protein